MVYSHFGDYVNRGSICKSSSAGTKMGPLWVTAIIQISFVWTNNPLLHPPENQC